MLRINEVFDSIEGELSPFLQGRLTTFVRMAGCNLRCSFCDTPYAQQHQPTDRILSTEKTIKIFYNTHLRHPHIRKLTLTGGEPLLQEEGVRYLVELAVADGKLVTIETNGSVKPEVYIFNPNVAYIVDYKLPSSGVEHKMKKELHCGLSAKDVVKFVVGDYGDYKRARELIEGEFRGIRATIGMQPVWEKLHEKILYKWLKRDKLTQVVIGVQLHKILKLK